MRRRAGLGLALLALGLHAGAANAAERVYEITINHWAATNNQGEVQITWKAKVSTSGSRTSTSSAGVLCAGETNIWKWSTGSNPSIKQLASRTDQASGTAMLKAQGTITGQKPVKFWANMGLECGSSSNAESNVVQKTINIVR
jgi:hypothetical protein